MLDDNVHLNYNLTKWDKTKYFIMDILSNVGGEGTYTFASVAWGCFCGYAKGKGVNLPATPEYLATIPSAFDGIVIGVPKGFLKEKEYVKESLVRKVSKESLKGIVGRGTETTLGFLAGLLISNLN